jgi:uncharacterized protein YciI
VHNNVITLRPRNTVPTAVEQEADLLRVDLERLDAHDAETRRLLSGPLLPVGTFPARDATRRDLTTAALERSRLLLRVLAVSP